MAVDLLDINIAPAINRFFRPFNWLLRFFVLLFDNWRESPLYPIFRKQKNEAFKLHQLYKNSVNFITISKTTPIASNALLLPEGRCTHKSASHELAAAKKKLNPNGGLSVDPLGRSFSNRQTPRNRWHVYYEVTCQCRRQQASKSATGSVFITNPSDFPPSRANMRFN